MEGSFPQKRIDDPKKAEAMARAGNESRRHAVDFRQLAKEDARKLFTGEKRSGIHGDVAAAMSDANAERAETLVQKAIEEVMEETKGMSEEELKQSRDRLDKEINDLRSTRERAGGLTWEEGDKLQHLNRKLEVYNDLLRGALDRAA